MNVDGTSPWASAVNAVSNAVTAVQNNPFAQLAASAYMVLGGLMEGNSGAISEGYEEGSGILEEGASALDQGVTTLYRAVQDGELQNIIDTDTYNLNPAAGGIVKGFYPTPGQASNFATILFGNNPQEGPYTLTSTSVTTSSLPEPTYLGGEGRTSLRHLRPVQ